MGINKIKEDREKEIKGLVDIENKISEELGVFLEFHGIPSDLSPSGVPLEHTIKKLSYAVNLSILAKNIQGIRKELEKV